jgi:hypothetical protein
MHDLADVSMSEERRETFSARTGLALAPFERAQSNLTIRVWPSQDGHPLGDYGENLPWLAFCSGNYLKREGRLIPLPCAILRHTRDRFAYTDKTITFKDEPRLPKTVALYHDQLVPAPHKRSGASSKGAGTNGTSHTSKALIISDDPNPT